MEQDLTGLLENVRAGTLPREAVVEKRGQRRLGPVDEDLAVVKDGLKTNAYSGEKSLITPDQYEEAVGPFKPYAEILNRALIIVTTLRREKISYGREPENMFRLWPKHRRKTPHLETILRLKRELSESLQTAEEAYERWKAENEKLKDELGGKISEISKSAGEAKSQYDMLQRVYKALGEGMRNPRAEWYAQAADLLKCDMNLSVILGSLDMDEKSLKAAVTGIRTNATSIAGILEEEIKAHDTGDYLLTIKEIGAEQNEGLQGELQTAQETMSWYKDPSDKEETLFENGVTIATEESLSMIEAMKAIIDITPDINDVGEYRNQLDGMISELNEGKFSRKYDISFDRESAVQKAEKAFSDVLGYDNLKQHYLDKFSGLDELQKKVQEAYKAGCKALQAQTSTYLGMTRVELEEVDGTFEGIRNLCEQIEAARGFSYEGVKPTNVIAADRLEKLREFGYILERAKTRLSVAADSRVARYMEEFNDGMKTAKKWEEDGAGDWDFKDGVAKARRYADMILEQPPSHEEPPNIDPRVDHLFTHEEVRAVTIPSNKLAQLEAWEQKIADYKREYGF